MCKPRTALRLSLRVNRAPPSASLRISLFHRLQWVHLIDSAIQHFHLCPAACHIAKNYLAHTLDIKVSLILGIWGGKGQGKTCQTELIFRAMGVEPVIMSAGEL